MSKQEAVSPGLLKLLDRFQIVFIGLVAVLAVVLAAQSLGWRIQHDAPMVLYPGYLFINGYGVPYKDTFDVNLPGSFLLYGLIGKVFGYSDLALRGLDVGLSGVICFLAWRVFRSLNSRAAVFGSLCFALLYLSNSWWTALQREFFIVLFVLAALYLLVVCSFRGRYLVVGFLAGCCLLIKPQSVPVFIWLMVWDIFVFRRDSNARMRALSFGIGLIAPVVATAAYMSASGAMGPWLDMMRNYWPLYGAIGGDIRVVEPGEKAGIVFHGLLMMGGYYLFFVVGILTAVAAYFRYRPAEDSGWEGGAERRSLLFLLVGICFLFWLYPAVPGQFWLYHWLPFVFFACILVGLAFGSLDLPVGQQAVALGLLAGSVALASLFFVKPAYFQVFSKPPPVKQGRVDEMVDYLRPRLRAGDTVQPLDWTGGAVHAMLILRARMATRYMQDFYLYHHVSNPYIQFLRRDFLSHFLAARPRFVLRVLSDDKPWPSGADTTRSLPELEAVLARDYSVVKERADYQILERR